MTMQGFPRVQRGAPPNLLAQDPWGREAPEGYGFHPVTGELVQYEYPTDANRSPEGMPWGMGNPLWEALYKGLVTIEDQPGAGPHLPSRYGKQYDHLRSSNFQTQGNVTMVPLKEYQKDGTGDLPTQDNGTLALIAAGQLGDVARVHYHLPQALTVYVEVPSPDAIAALAIVDSTQVPALNVAPAQVATTAPPIGGAVAVSNLRFGHRGVQLSVWFDTPQAQIVKTGIGGSFGMVTSMLAPKYFTNSDAAGLRTYLLFPGGPTLNNALWNGLTQNILIQNSFTNPNKVGFSGWFAKAPVSPLPIDKPVRRFYGSVKTNGTIATQNTRCPIAWYANQVTLIGGAYSTTTAGNQVLQFVINGLTNSSGVTQVWGPFPMNQTVQIPVGATSIDVINSPTALGAVGAALEVLFELDYTLSF